MDIFADHGVIWTLVVAVGFPVLSIALVELQRLLEPRSVDGAKVCGLLLRTVMPPLALFLLLDRIGGASRDGAASKLVLSVLAITAINAVLVAVNAVMRSDAMNSDGQRRATGLVLDLARLLVVLVASAVVASEIWGVDLGSMLTALGVGSVVLGLALQDTVSGLFAGLSLLSGRHFKEGDWIEAGGIEGRIVHVSWRTVTVETLDDERLVVIPNSSLASSQFTVLTTATRSYGANLQVRFAYGTPPARAEAALEQAIETTSIVLPEPPYDIDLIAIDDQGFLFDAVVHAPSRSEGEEAVSEILSKLWYICQREGLVLAGAANRLSTFTNPRRPSVAERAEHLAATYLFPADAQSFDRVVANARHQFFDNGEELVGLGDPFDRLYVVIGGTLEASVRRGDETRVVQQVEAGELFVVRAFLSGSPSPVTLTADGEVEVLAVDAEVVLHFLDDNPSLARRMERAIDVTEAGLASTPRGH